MANHLTMPWRIPRCGATRSSRLSDPTRREILKLLRGGEKSAGELADHFADQMSKPSVSHHFTVLKSADLIVARRSGQQIFYALNTTVVQDLLALLWELFPASPPGGKETSS